ncbi:hypothetical protein [Nostoc sp. CHAB 5715]|nr:hypothetical protein [Nostoc sp. CHAB 5715]
MKPLFKLPSASLHFSPELTNLEVLGLRCDRSQQNTAHKAVFK